MQNSKKDFVQLLVDSKLCTSRTDAIRCLKQGAIKIKYPEDKYFTKLICKIPNGKQ